MPRRIPSTPQEFVDWMSENLTIEFSSSRIVNHYGLVVHRLKDQVVTSPFWQALLGEYGNWNELVRVDRGQTLFMTTEPTEPVTKTFESILDKSFRVNVLRNQDRWPEAPSDGWVTPSNWFTSFTDVVRTTLKVRYLDDVRTVARHLVSIARASGTEYRDPTYEAGFDGYYAVQFVALIDVSIPDLTLIDNEEFQLGFEIKITTQLKDVIEPLLHDIYVQDRSAGQTSHQWAWDHESKEFSAHYLGHMVQYIEGMIATTRDRLRKE